MTDPFQDTPPIPMIKEETVKDDGRTLIYYTFLSDSATPIPTASLPETAHV